MRCALTLQVQRLLRLHPRQLPPVQNRDRAILYDLQETGDEYQLLAKQFQATIHGMRPDLRPQVNDVRILKIQRVENLGLWQSYAAKKASMLQRAKIEGIDASRYERFYFWHGTNAEVVECIYQQVCRDNRRVGTSKFLAFIHHPCHICTGL